METFGEDTIASVLEAGIAYRDGTFVLRGSRPVICPVCNARIVYIRATTVDESKVVAICNCSELIG